MDFNATQLTNSFKFLLVRYAEGSAGAFLSSVLSCSTSIAHSDALVEHNKTSDMCVEYIKSHYTNDMSNWLLREPKPQEAIGFHFISTRFDRGNHLTVEEFINLCKTDATPYFWESVNNNKIVPMLWHKKIVPIFFNNPMIVTIIVDDASAKWYHRALWYKKYGIKDGKIHIKADDPTYNPNRAVYFKKFNNPYLLDISPYTFIKNNIINSPAKNLFSSNVNFNDHTQFIKLLDILDENKFVAAINRICISFNLATVPTDIIRASHQHWISCHDF